MLAQVLCSLTVYSLNNGLEGSPDRRSASECSPYLSYFEHNEKVEQRKTVARRVAGPLA